MDGRQKGGDHYNISRIHITSANGASRFLSVSALRVAVSYPTGWSAELLGGGAGRLDGGAGEFPFGGVILGRVIFGCVVFGGVVVVGGVELTFGGRVLGFRVGGFSLFGLFTPGLALGLFGWVQGN